MRKQEKKELDLAMRGISLPLCPEHKLPLVRHENDDWADGKKDYCWDCPGKMTKERQERLRQIHSAHYDDNSPCDYHVHENPSEE
jgi:hypothetical protein